MYHSDLKNNYSKTSSTLAYQSSTDTFGNDSYKSQETISVQQFQDDLTVAFSLIGQVPHNYRLAVYGGACAVPGEYRQTARDLAIQHRLKTARNPLKEQAAAREIDSELRDPSRCSMQSFLRYVEKNGGPIPADERQRLAVVAGEHVPAHQAKPNLEELFESWMDTARATSDRNFMSGKDEGSTWNRRAQFGHIYKLSLDDAARISPLGKKSPCPTTILSNHPYLRLKELGDAHEAIDASALFLCNQTLYVPFVSPYGLENRWQDHLGNPVEMSRTELHISNCCSYLRITLAGEKLMLEVASTKGLGFFIGEVLGASLVILVEGIATGLSVYEATGIPVVCVGGCENFKYVVAALWDAEVCNRILMIGDDGTEAKLDLVYKAAKANSWQAERRLAWVTTPGKDNYDLNDMMIDAGLDSVKSFVEDCVERFFELNQPKPEKAFIRSAQEILADDYKADYLLDEIIPRASLGSIIGETGAGKSFYALDIACSIVAGIEFHGHKVKQANVLYVVGEGARGYRSRIEAWRIKNHLPTAPEGLYLTAGAVDLLDKEKLQEISDFCQANNIGMAVFDTLHRCFSGEENSARDIGIALQNLGKFLTEKGVAVILVHHTGHAAGGRGRGSSSVKAAMDWELLVEKCEGGIKVTPTKIKDGELFSPETFLLRKQETSWLNEDGEFISSLILEQGNTRKALQLDRKQSNWWNALKSLGKNFTRKSAEEVTFSLIDSRNKGQALDRFLTKMINGGWLEFHDDHYRFLT
jgi:RecA-family ATPase